MMLYTFLCFPISDFSLEAASQAENGVMCNLETRESKILLRTVSHYCQEKTLQMSVQIQISIFSNEKKSGLKIPSLSRNVGVLRVCLAFDFSWRDLKTCTDLCKLLQFLKWSRAKGGGYYVITCLIVLVEMSRSMAPNIFVAHAWFRGMTGSNR